MSVVESDDESGLVIVTEVNVVHLANISLILVTFDVSKLLKSSEVNLLHPPNISLILVTFDVSKFSKPII